MSIAQSRAKAYEELGVGSPGLWVYGSFYRPIEFTWARKLIGLGALLEPERKKHAPWTYVMCEKALPEAVVEDYELTLIAKGNE